MVGLVSGQCRQRRTSCLAGSRLLLLPLGGGVAASQTFLRGNHLSQCDARSYLVTDRSAYRAWDSACRWAAAPRTDLSLLRKKLKQLGFQEQEPWLWSAAARWPAAPGAQPLGLDLRFHNIRMSMMFRYYCFDAFLASKRRDVASLKREHSCSAEKLDGPGGSQALPCLAA